MDTIVPPVKKETPNILYDFQMDAVKKAFVEGWKEQYEASKQ